MLQGVREITHLFPAPSPRRQRLSLILRLRQWCVRARTLRLEDAVAHRAVHRRVRPRFGPVDEPVLHRILPAIAQPIDLADQQVAPPFGIVDKLQPRIEAIEDQMRAVFGDGRKNPDFMPFDDPQRGWYAEIESAHLMADDTFRAATIRGYPDPRGAAMLALNREAHTNQAIGRIRAVKPGMPKRILILSSLVLPGLPINRGGGGAVARHADRPARDPVPRVLALRPARGQALAVNCLAPLPPGKLSDSVSTWTASPGRSAFSAPRSRLAQRRRTAAAARLGRRKTGTGTARPRRTRSARMRPTVPSRRKDLRAWQGLPLPAQGFLPGLKQAKYAARIVLLGHGLNDVSETYYGLRERETTELRDFVFVVEADTQHMRPMIRSCAPWVVDEAASRACRIKASFSCAVAWLSRIRIIMRRASLAAA